MSLLVGLENNVEGRCLAWALEHPGCFTYGAGPDSALDALPQAIVEYDRWIAALNPEGSWLEKPFGEPQVADTWDVYTIDEEFNLNADGDYEVNAWFRYDWKPLTSLDLERALKLLDWSRLDLLQAIAGLEKAALHANHAGEFWSIYGILGHVAGAEWWYLDRLEMAFPREQVLDEPFQRLTQVRQHLLEILPSLAGSQLVVGRRGELWSPRKLLRRALWHERDHTTHILKLR